MTEKELAGEWYLNYIGMGRCSVAFYRLYPLGKTQPIRMLYQARESWQLMN
jgi:hypothetical protein